MPDDDHIEIMDKNTRRRNGKLERLDPITGCWVLHPMQFFHDNQKEMERMFEEIDKDEERERKEMFDIKRAQEFVEHAADEDEAGHIAVEKVIHVTSSGGISKSHSMEIIFDGKLKGKHGRYLATCSSFSGDFYEPPNEECWIENLKESIEYLEQQIQERTKPGKDWLDRESHEEIKFKPITNKKEYNIEKSRLESIWRCDIERLKYLKKYQPTWKYK